MGFSATDRSTPATSSRRETSRRPTTGATSSAARLAGRSRKIACSSSPTTRARGPGKASRRSPTCRRRPSVPAISRSACCRRPSTRSRSGFPGDRLPAEFINPIGRAGGSVSAAESQRAVRELRLVAQPRRRNDQFDLRVDRPMGGKLDLSARYSFTDRELFEPFAGPGFAARAGIWQQSIAAAELRRLGLASCRRAAERGAVRLHARRQRGESGRAGHEHQQPGWLARAVVQPARLGA